MFSSLSLSLSFSLHWCQFKVLTADYFKHCQRVFEWELSFKSQNKPPGEKKKQHPFLFAQMKFLTMHNAGVTWVWYMYMASVANKFYSLVLEHRGVNSKTQRFKASHSPSFIFFGIVIIYCHYSYFILSQARDERTIF